MEHGNPGLLHADDLRHLQPMLLQLPLLLFILPEKPHRQGLPRSQAALRQPGEGYSPFRERSREQHGGREQDRRPILPLHPRPAHHAMGRPRGRVRRVRAQERRHPRTPSLLRQDRLPPLLFDQGGMVDGGRAIHGAFRPAHAQLARQNQHHHRRRRKGQADRKRGTISAGPPRSH